MPLCSTQTAKSEKRDVGFWNHQSLNSVGLCQPGSWLTWLRLQSQNVWIVYVCLDAFKQNHDIYCTWKTGIGIFEMCWTWTVTLYVLASLLPLIQKLPCPKNHSQQCCKNWRVILDKNAMVETLRTKYTKSSLSLSIFHHVMTICFRCSLSNKHLK